MKQIIALIALMLVVVAAQSTAGATLKDLDKVCKGKSNLSAKDISGMYDQMMSTFEGKKGLIDYVIEAKGNFELQIQDAGKSKVLAGYILAEHTKTICDMYNTILDVLANAKQ